MRKRENEDEFEYGLRLIESKMEKTSDIDWQDIVEELNLNINRDTLRKASQTKFGGYNVMKHYKNKLENNVAESDEILNEIKQQKIELEKEKIKYQDQKREYRNYLRADARFDNLRDTMINEIKRLNTERPLLQNINIPNIESENEAVLILSDWHLGLEVENYWNKFNVEKAKERVNQLLEKTIEYCRLHNVNTLHLELLGDLINGYIHIGTRISNEEDVITQTMLCAEILSEFIHKLSKEINNIKIYGSTGNHGRCSANIKESIETENFEKLIIWYLKARVHLDTVEFVDNKYDENIIVHKVCNKTIFAVHGHKDKLNKAVNDLSQMLKIFPSEIHMGHYHKHYEYSKHDIEVIVNGCLSGVDEYAKSIRKTGKPMQKLLIYNNDGQVGSFQIKLD